jgi:hypothetical protein
MNVCIRVAGANRGDDFFKLTGPKLLTASRCSGCGHDACSRNRPSKMTRPIGAVRGPDRTSIRRRLAKPDDDTTIHTRLADVDVRLCRQRSLQPYVNSKSIDCSS